MEVLYYIIFFIFFIRINSIYVEMFMICEMYFYFFFEIVFVLEMKILKK